MSYFVKENKRINEKYYYFKHKSGLDIYVFPKKMSSSYALFGVDRGGSNFWGEPTTFLGWYASEEQISKEIAEIHRAILQGIPTYTLQFSAKTQRRWASIKIVEE